MVLQKAALAVAALLGFSSASHVEAAAGDCFEYGYDFVGFDLEQAPSAETPSHCMESCAKTQGCAFWTWNRHTKACYLKSGGAFTRKVPQGNMVSGPRQCLYGVKCFETGWDYHGYDVEKVEDRFVISAIECQRLCALNPQCAFFSWKASTYSCYLKESAAPMGRTADSDVISGPRACPSSMPSLPSSPTNEFDPATAPPPCVEPNVEYRGFTVSSVKTKTIHGCQIACVNKSECSYWTYNMETNMCHLKDANALNGRAEDEGSLKKVSGSKSCIPVLADCQFVNVGVAGANLALTSAATYEECQFNCIQQSGCTHWTLDINTLTCTLWTSFSAYTKGNSTQGQISGPEFCSTQQTCFEQADYVGHDVEKIETGQVPSPSSCQALCQGNNHCYYWTWLSGKHCYLKSADALLTKVNDTSSLGRFSGPKTCSVTYGCVRINTAYSGTTLKQISASDYISCASSCKALPTCEAWNYYGDHKYCVLKAAGAALVTEGIRGALSGSRRCPATVDETVEEQCFEQGLRYSLDTIAGLYDNVDSADECYSKCQASSTCKWFSYANGDHCYLLSSVAEPQIIYDTMSISGPKECTDTHENTFLIKGYQYSKGLITNRSAFVYTPGSCAKRCENEERCAFWTYVKGSYDTNCFLYDVTAAGSTEANDNAVLGQKILRPFISRGCTFTSSFTSSAANNPHACQIECQLHHYCDYWTWSYTTEGTEIVPLCEYFGSETRQIFNNDIAHYTCGTKQAPGKLKYNWTFDGTEASSSSLTSIIECEQACVERATCTGWSLNTESATCHLFDARGNLQEADGFVSGIVVRPATGTMLGTMFKARSKANVSRQRLSSPFKRRVSTFRFSESATNGTSAESLNECLSACQKKKECVAWSFKDTCSLLTGPYTASQEHNAVSGSRNATAFKWNLKFMSSFNESAEKVEAVADAAACADLAEGAQCWTYDRTSGNCKTFNTCSTSEEGHSCISGEAVAAAFVRDLFRYTR